MSRTILSEQSRPQPTNKQKHLFSHPMLLTLIAGMALSLGTIGCKRVHSGTSTKRSSSKKKSKMVFPAFAKKAKNKASSAFWKHWGDGKAELTGYAGLTPRYGQMRKATAALIYVTEPFHRLRRIKDDYARGAYRIPMLKLNRTLKFKTGIYPYSVMNSVFSPASQYFHHKFTPLKISLTVQEWCGHVFQAIWPGENQLRTQIRSYFASEGDKSQLLKVAKDVLYEDALFIQLRELDGPFLSKKKSWKGKLIPSLWKFRRIHKPVQSVNASLQRSTVKTAQGNIQRFVLKYGTYTRTFDVESKFPRRILQWTSSEGEKMILQKTVRLPYWQLNGNGDQKYRKQMGLP